MGDLLLRDLRPAPLFALALLAPLAGCLLNPPATWNEFHVSERPFEQVWLAVVEKAALNGFKPEVAGPDATDRGMRVYHSKWVSREYGFRNTLRRRVHAEFEEVEEQPGGWTVRVRCERQAVKDMAKVEKPTEVDWSNDGQDTDVEQRIAIQVQMHFGATDAVKPRARGTESGK